MEIPASANAIRRKAPVGNRAAPKAVSNDPDGIEKAATSFQAPNGIVGAQIESRT
jgi:hypothetical protein